MKVILAEAIGMCFGVRDALAVMRGIAVPAEVTVRGELVHNPAVTSELRRRGFVMGSPQQGVRETPVVLITAHGCSDRERLELVQAGKVIVDTTCPLVRKAHAAAMQLEAEGAHVLVVGKRGHVEVRGLTGDLKSVEVIEAVGEVRRWPFEKLGAIAQTTAMERDVAAIVERIRVLNPQARVRFINTICQPTRDRQLAVERLLEQIDVLVVVGGRESNNTLQLVKRARKQGTRCLHVQEDRELCEGDFVAGDIVGLTAGTSTLPKTIEAVRRRLTNFYSDGNA